MDRRPSRRWVGGRSKRPARTCRIPSDGPAAHRGDRRSVCKPGQTELILASLPDTLSGNDVEVAQYRLDESQKLAESDNADVRAVGEAGVRLYTPYLRPRRKRLAKMNSAGRSV